jgi:acylphosphatase
MAEVTKARLHVIVEGRVQGVGYRYFVLDNAISLGIDGWVRNRYDQSVEVVAEGIREDLERLVAILWKGPRSAFVTRVKSEWLELTGEFSGFSVKSTV